MTLKNGFNSHGFHANEDPETAESIRPSADKRKRGRAAKLALIKHDFRKVARAYLNNAFASKALPSFVLPVVGGQSSELAITEVRECALKKTRIIKLRQKLNGVPISRSLATVELDHDNQLVCFHSAFGEPHGVSPAAKVSPVSAHKILQDQVRTKWKDQKISPRLAYYFHIENQSWHLAYVAEDVLRFEGSANSLIPEMPIADYVIDANDGQVIDILPRACGATITALDAMNRPRQFQTSLDVITAGQQMQDPTLNIHTRDFAFQDVSANFNNLPGEYVHAPPLPWHAGAVSAHANAELVATFFLNILGRKGLDGHGSPLVSSINCVWGALGSTGRNWPNSFWIKNQAVFGQRQSGPQTRSFAAALDMVAHEFFHGVTQYSSRLDMKGQTGALNESYSDIFGILIANGLNPDWESWRWEIGVDTGLPLRDMRQPSRFGQPEHMGQYQNAPLSNDFGGIHLNCGIHNKAAFNIMNSTDPKGRFLFHPQLMAQIFYHAVIELPSNALFSQSRQMVELQARTVLRNDPQIGMKLDAIRNGFAAVGIL